MVSSNQKRFQLCFVWNSSRRGDPPAGRLARLRVSVAKGVTPRAAPSMGMMVAITAWPRACDKSSISSRIESETVCSNLTSCLCSRGVFLPVGTWQGGMLYSHNGPNGFLAAPLGKHFELVDERCETRRQRLRYGVVDLFWKSRVKRRLIRRASRAVVCGSVAGPIRPRELTTFAIVRLALSLRPTRES